MNKEHDIALFVHELYPQVGHSRALIETVRNFPANEISSLHIVAIECGDLEELFPKLKGKVFLHKVPEIPRAPMLLKMLYFFVMSWLYKKTKLPAKCKTIGVGIASLSVDYVNVQFVHHEWDYFYFRHIALSPINYIYKKILYFCYNIGELYLYRFKNDTKFSVLSQFETNFLHDFFKVPKNRMVTNYSSVNTDEFEVKNISRTDLYGELKNTYPELSIIDPNKPIYLFVGALERKGIKFTFDALKEVADAQLIVVGSSESASTFSLDQSVKHAHIKFTKEIKKFYDLCDCFVFPTIYEPFGLVLTEAASMGLEIYTTRYKVGASEILEDLQGIHIFDYPQDIKITPLQAPLTYEQKLENSNKRKKNFEDLSWEKAGLKFWELIKS